MRFVDYRLNTQVLLHHLSPYQFTEVRRTSLVLTGTMLAPKACPLRLWLWLMGLFCWQIAEM